MNLDERPRDDLIPFMVYRCGANSTFFIYLSCCIDRYDFILLYNPPLGSVEVSGVVMDATAISW
jgi:hypothetical protein